VNQPGNEQYPGQGQTVIQAGPPGQGQQPQYVAASPQYVAAPPPGVAVQLPGATQPGYPGAAGYGGYAQPAQPVQQPQANFPAPAPAPVAPVQMQVHVPASAKPASANSDQLLPGVGRTVYEFGGAHSEEARSGGKHQTFFADAGQLGAAPIREERHSNLSGGSSTMIVGGIAVAVLTGLLAFFLKGEGEKHSDEHAAEPEVVAAPATTPEPAPPVDPAAVPPVPEGTPPPVDPAATPAGAVEPPKPAEEVQPAPQPAPQPANDPPPAEPAKKKSTSTKKKTTPAPAPEPEPEKKRKVSPISPSKPPRDGLDTLPAPD
jgi:hypothetical protein